MKAFEFIESKTGDANIAILDSVLAKLKKWRDLAAHSHANVIQCDPSRIILEFEKIFPILKKIEKNHENCVGRTDWCGQGRPRCRH